ncbi:MULTISPECIES: DUF92 domain-containing protein [Acidiplasma]|jgi:uncharacterized protein (TIGR00297 family)|uniref:TIGR00297 family protein n=3 Tax=Acidiplasma TaxID=507753 RepID=A0A0Q1B4L2_9ARCH|nr:MULTISPECIES: DUF92 domain-containing protein [Acidiplasma]KPV46456.1 hypothetical protein SE19_05415 [Acidiplasma aeolicum]KQB34893.1 hypothetical protein AOG55_08695 [Acidiplasma cupricumulans]KQB36631.1 hypothetical protein AOG54_07125 [Acidiplasma aeolicum]
MIISVDYIVAAILILSSLFVLSLVFNVFDLKGTIAALIVGIIITFAGSIYWLILMLIFAATAFMATKYRIQQKAKMKLQEGRDGERHASNVIYAALIGLIIAVFNVFKVYNLPYFELFSISFASVNADTFASEIGVFDKNVRLITNFKKIVPGINGGISLLGELAAVFGAFIIAFSYSVLNFHNINIISILIITFLGFLGCQFDSILGAVFENKNKMTKGQVNAASTLMAVFVGILFSF